MQPAAIERLKKVYPVIGAKLCAERFGITRDTVRRILRKAGVPSMYGTKVESHVWRTVDHIIRDKYRTYTAPEIAENLTEVLGVSVTKNMVIGRAHRIGLRKRGTK